MKLQYKLLAILSLCISLVAVSAVSVVVGIIVGERGAYHRRFLEQHEFIRKEISASDRYRDLSIREASAGFAYLLGTADADSVTTLREVLTLEYGAPLADKMTRTIDVRDKATMRSAKR